MAHMLVHTELPSSNQRTLDSNCIATIWQHVHTAVKTAAHMWSGASTAAAAPVVRHCKHTHCALQKHALYTSSLTAGAR
eukprot:10456-Heterococcus_DN1.PRE.7